MDKNKKIVIGIVAIIVLLIIIFMARSANSGNEDIPETPIEESQEPIASVEPTGSIEPKESASIPESSENATIEEDEEDNEIVYNVTDEDIYNIMDVAVDRLLEYTADSTISNRIISNNGYVYSINTHKNLDPTRVFRDETFANIDINKIKLLYVIPDDVLKFSDAEMRVSSGSSPDMFFAYEFDDYYIIGNDNSGGGKITKAQLDELLAVYENNAEIVEYTRDTAEYMDMEFLAANELESLEGGVATRYVAGDGKYAVLITSPATRADDIHAYLYKMGAEGYDLLESDFQMSESYEKDISLKYPDFNNAIMPNYDLDDFIGYLEGNVGYIGNSITDAGALVYGCGYGDLYYLEYDSGSAYVLVRTGTENNKENFSAYQVATTGDAKAVLDENVKRNPPYIILKQY